MESISIPDTVQLYEISINGNNISRIDNGTFAGQPGLIHLNLRANGIQELDEDAFTGLSVLESLVLIGNDIQVIAPRTFHPLASVMYLDLERNNLTSIGEDIFSHNTEIRTLYLEFNQIEEISPRFLSSFGNNLSYINLSGNICVDRSFYFTSGDDLSIVVLHSTLRNCYNNFSGRSTDDRDITMHYKGHLRLFDEFGNLVGSV